MKTYKIKKLVDGYKVDTKHRGKTLVCCRMDRNYTHIQHDKHMMKLPLEPLDSKQQEDQFNREPYWLNYYEWEPISATELWDKK